jgi:Zn-dependent protease
MTVVTLIILIISIVCHEMGHAGVATILGDPTAKKKGRLSLNPVVHLDIMGSLVIPAILWITNASFLFGWAKPVPINPTYFRSQNRGMMLVALAGPMVNFVLMGIGWTIMSFTVEYPEWFQMALSLYMINAVLMIFNLIPIPPLDGSRIIGGFLPNNIALYWQRLDPYGMLLVVGLIISGGVDHILSYFIPLVSKIISTIINSIGIIGS